MELIAFVVLTPVFFILSLAMRRDKYKAKPLDIKNMPKSVPDSIWYDVIGAALLAGIIAYFFTGLFESVFFWLIIGIALAAILLVPNIGKIQLYREFKSPEGQESYKECSIIYKDKKGDEHQIAFFIVKASVECDHGMYIADTVMFHLNKVNKANSVNDMRYRRLYFSDNEIGFMTVLDESEFDVEQGLDDYVYSFETNINKWYKGGNDSNGSPIVTHKLGTYNEDHPIYKCVKEMCHYYK